MTSKQPEPLLYLDDHRGVYIPQNFAECTRRDCVTGIDAEQWAILEAGPDHEWYWEAWQEVCDNARVTEPDTGITYTLYQDGALWLIPEGMFWDDKLEFFTWDDPDQPTEED